MSMSEEQRRKISESLRGRKKPPRTAEHAQRIAEANRGRRCPPDCTCGHHTRTKYKVCEPGCTCARHEQTEEHRRRNSEANKGHSVSEETRQRLSEANRGRNKGLPAVGFSYDKRGYKRLSGQQDHPLAWAGQVLACRKVLYDAIGPGPHGCHWGCGRTLEWGGRDGIQADHVNGDQADDRPENLVPSCISCNVRRGNAGNPTDWKAPPSPVDDRWTSPKK